MEGTELIRPHDFGASMKFSAILYFLYHKCLAFSCFNQHTIRQGMLVEDREDWPLAEAAI